MCNILSVILLHDLKNHESWSKMSFYSITICIFLIVQCTTFLYSSTTCWGYFGALKGQMVTLLVHKGGKWVGATTKQQQQQSNNKNCNFCVLVETNTRGDEFKQPTAGGPLITHRLNKCARLKNTVVCTYIPD